MVPENFKPCINPMYIRVVKPCFTGLILNYNLSQPRSRFKSRGDCAFAVVGPRLWNSLPVSLRSLSSLYEFKLKLKLYLLERAFI